jgi:hypothetical protein
MATTQKTVECATETKIPNVNGIFEVHLIVHPDDQTKLFSFSMEESTLAQKNCMNLKTTCALSFYGNYPNQPMLTFWVTGDSQDAVKTAINVSKQLEAYGVPVHRLKVEAMANSEEISLLPKQNGNNYGI